MKLSEVEILKVPCEVHVGERGSFSVFLLGRADAVDDVLGHAKPLARASTYEDVIERAKPEVRKRKVKVAVPFYRLVPWRGELHIERGTATGFHAGTGNVLAVINGGSEQIGSDYRSSTTLSADMPDADREELARLHREVAERRARISELQTQWSLDLRAAVTDAIEAAQGTPTPA